MAWPLAVIFLRILMRSPIDYLRECPTDYLRECPADYLRECPKIDSIDIN